MLQIMKSLWMNRKGMDAGIFFGGLIVGLLVGIGAVIGLGFAGINLVEMIAG